MNELIDMVAQKTGIGEEKARQAVDTVVGFLKDRLPGPVGAQLDGIISGSPNQVADDLRNKAAGTMGGLFGGGTGNA
ncbi:MAG TPA: hypothetical protein VFS40_10300 [Gemmatimonadales bacterium]|nr:hypothetical protein [Gemmatimonadales bacterium]